SLRPKSLSITEIETLFRSPYDLYAKYSLGLRPLDPLAEQVGARERGSFIHDIFEKFIAGGHDPDAPYAENILLELAEKSFSELDDMDDRREIWKRRFKTSATSFIAFERSRSKFVKTRFAEQKLHWTFPVQGQNFTLRGRADRIDILNDGSVAILDFKTGGVPSPKEMKEYLAPQLLAEAAIVAAAGFENQASASASELTYIKIGAGPVAFSLTSFALADGLKLDDAIHALMQILLGRVEALLLRDDLAMHARLIPKVGQTFRGAYEHLARTDEWTQIDAGEADG
ncbi:MAG: PD-(D/E)XK nuclease family protein, partial [Halocynthiibacter sp.]